MMYFRWYFNVDSFGVFLPVTELLCVIPEIF